MKVSGSDALVVSDSEAYSTVIEFPANTGIDSATLLAVQKWGQPLSSKEWKLELHQTRGRLCARDATVLLPGLRCLDTF